MKKALSRMCFGFGLAMASTAFGAEPVEPPAASPGAGPEASSEPTAEPSAKPTRSEPEASSGDEHGPVPDPGGHEFSDERFGHGMQFGLRVGAVGGYRMVFRYDKSPFCRAPDPAKSDKDQQKFCGHGAPFALDVALSFAPVDFAEPYAWARFGLGGEAETNTEPLLAFGVGARIYTMSDSKFKIFVEPALGVETESGAGNREWTFDDGTTPEYKTDFLFHLAVGPQYDFARAFGVYLNAGLTTGVLRYIHTELEVGIGAQVRVP